MVFFSNIFFVSCSSINIFFFGILICTAILFKYKQLFFNSPVITIFFRKYLFFFTPKVLPYSQFHPELFHFINFIANLFYMRHNGASPQLTDKQKYLNFPSYRECNYHIKVIKLIIF
jgi:hypothetical protein